MEARNSRGLLSGLVLLDTLPRSERREQRKHLAHRYSKAEALSMHAARLGVDDPNGLASLVQEWPCIAPQTHNGQRSPYCILPYRTVPYSDEAPEW